jgi:photosystem II stability/assembly factor-like uncharacterized protein
MKKSIFISFLFIISLVCLGSANAALEDNYANQNKSWSQHQELVNNSDFKSLEWRNIGPVVQGGRVVAVRSSNQNDNILYLAYASGGVWKSIDKGITFKPITDQLPSQIVGSLAVDPNDDNVLWLGTGENNSSRSSYGGMGVFRSDDAGKSWKHVGLGNTNRIGDILVDPSNSDRVYVASLGPLYTEGGDRGVFVTEDSGKTWKKTLPGDKKTGFIDLSLASNGDLYASAWQRIRSAWNFEESGKGSKIYKSSDHGQTWKALTNGLPTGVHVGRMGIDVAPSNPNIVYVSVDNQELLPEDQWDLGDTAINAKRLKTMSKQEFLTLAKKDIEGFLKSNKFPPETTADQIIEKITNDTMEVSDLVKSLKDANSNLFNSDIKGLEIYRSDDAGESFYKTHDLPLSNIVFTYGYYFGTMRVDPNDENTIYTMGVPLVKSKDGGKTWESLYNPKVHVDYQDLWVDPKNSNHIIAANDGGADESYDQGKNWRKLDYQPVGQFYTVAVDMKEPYNVYGGLQDNGTLKGSSTTDWKDGESWKRLFGGDGMYVSVDDEDNVYVGFQFGNNFKIKDGKPKSIKPPNFINEEPLRYNWNTPVVLSSHNTDIIYYGANKLFRSFDQGETWKAISKDLTQSFKRGDVPFATITSISESPLDFGRIIVGTDDGMVWVTDDDGKNWKNVSKKLPKKLWVSRVVASKYDKNTLWLTLNNYRNDDMQSYVYRSTDFGKKWQDISNNLPNSAANVIKEDPKTEGLVYVGTDRGVYFSNDSGSNWQTLGDSFPTVPVHDLIVHPRENELVVATHGRSMWVSDVTSVQNLKDYTDKDLTILAIDDIKFSSAWNSRPSRWFNFGDKELSSFSIWSDSDKEASITILNTQDQALFESTMKLSKGLNIWKWDNQLNVDMALAAEELKNSKEGEFEKPLNKSLTPVAEGIRLGHDIYIQKGKYKLQVTSGDTEETADFEVK